MQNSNFLTLNFGFSFSVSHNQNNLKYFTLCVINLFVFDFLKVSKHFLDILFFKWSSWGYIHRPTCTHLRN